MEIIFEILFELLFQVVFEVIIELGGRGIARLLDTRIGRVVVPAIVMGAFGYGGGYAWGRHVATVQDSIPRTIWVSLALAVLAAGLAVRMRINSDWDERVASLPTLLRPTAQRFAMLSFLNVTIALGVTAGFNS